MDTLGLVILHCGAVLDIERYLEASLVTSLVAQMVKNLPAMQETWVQSLGQDDSLEKKMATHSSILAGRIPWTEEPGRLQSMGSQRVGPNWATNIHTLAFIQIDTRSTHNLSCEIKDVSRNYQMPVDQGWITPRLETPTSGSDSQLQWHTNITWGAWKKNWCLGLTWRHSDVAGSGEWLRDRKF